MEKIKAPLTGSDCHIEVILKTCWIVLQFTRRVLRYQSDIQNPYIEEEHTNNDQN